MRDGESTAAFLTEMFGDCGIDDALEVEMHLFISLRKEISEQKAKRVAAESRCDQLEAELSRYKQGVEVEGVVEEYYDFVLWGGRLDIPLPKDMIGQRVRVLVMKEGGDE